MTERATCINEVKNRYIAKDLNYLDAIEALQELGVLPQDAETIISDLDDDQ